MLAQLRVGRPLADAGQRPADGLRAAVRDARGDQRVDDFQLRRLEPDHHVDDVALGRLARVIEAHDEAAAPAVAAGIFVPEPEVLDLRPPLCQVAPELLECRAVGPLQLLKCRAGPGPPNAAGRFGQDQRGQQLSRLEVRVVAVRFPVHPAHRAREERPYLIFDLVPDAVFRGLVHLRPPAVTLVTQITAWPDCCQYLLDELEYSASLSVD